MYLGAFQYFNAQETELLMKIFCRRFRLTRIFSIFTTDVITQNIKKHNNKNINLSDIKIISLRKSDGKLSKYK